MSKTNSLGFLNYDLNSTLQGSLDKLADILKYFPPVGVPSSSDSTANSNNL